MTTLPIYPACPIKKCRATKLEMQARLKWLWSIVEAMRPMTVRQVFYQATVRHIVEKTEQGYSKVQIALANMRRARTMPYDWIVDFTRRQRKPRTFDGVEDALEETARFYRKSLWTQAKSYTEIWLEKDALSGVILPVTSKYDVPLMVARGYASLSFLSEAAEYIEAEKRPVFIYHLGDFDPSGVNAGEKIELTLRELAPTAEIYFERIAVTREQIAAWSLPARPTKQSDSRAKGFGALSVELDAIAPNQLRTLVEKAIERHLPPHEYRLLMAAEESERQAVAAFVRGAPCEHDGSREPPLPQGGRARGKTLLHGPCHHGEPARAGRGGHGYKSRRQSGTQRCPSDAESQMQSRWSSHHGGRGQGL